ncbi:hypothetical protein ACGFR6_22130 [Streptomyces sp. NPDC048567]|uniref:hypothetical protein n=1 Tax=Streptomyces sp. NPDC048567 TaxID=3365570 RepID=UPI00372318C8
MRRPIELDTEFTLWQMTGSTLTEAVAFERSAYQDEPATAYARLAAELGSLGLRLGATDYDALDDSEYAVDPEKLMEDLAEAERAVRGLG